MDKIQKLFKKLRSKERKNLLKIVQKIISGDKNKELDIKKIKNTNFYRVRTGRFRIIFHYKKDSKPEIDSIKLRNEKTYK